MGSQVYLNSSNVRLLSRTEDKTLFNQANLVYYLSRLLQAILNVVHYDSCCVKGSGSMRILFGCLIACSILGMSVSKSNADGVPPTLLLSTSKTVMDEDIAYPTSGKPIIKSMIITLDPGKSSSKHHYGVPMFAHILEGEVTIDYGAKGSRVYKKGDTFMQTLNVDHVGTNTGAIPVKILIVNLSAEGVVDVIPAK